MATASIFHLFGRRCAGLGLIAALCVALPSTSARAQAGDPDAQRLEDELFGDEPSAPPEPEPVDEAAPEETAPEDTGLEFLDEAEAPAQPPADDFLDETEFTTGDEPAAEEKFEFEFVPPPPEDTEEIIIRGEKRESSAQSEAIAITEFDQTALDEFGVQDIQGLQDFVPSLHIGQVGNLAIITIRGVGLENITNVGEPSVIFEQDGVPIGRPTAALAAAFFDLEGLNVLRGPQGTNGGRQSTGGKISLSSAKPKPEFELFGDFQYGTRNQKITRGALNVPIFDEYLMARLAVFHEDRDGYQKNEFQLTKEAVARLKPPNRPVRFPIPGSGGEFFDNRWLGAVPVDLTERSAWADDAENFALRGQLMSQATDDLELRTIVSYSQQAGVGPGPVSLVPFDPRACPDDTAPADICPADSLGATGLPSTGIDPRVALIDQPQYRDNFQVGATFNATWELPTLPLLGDTRFKAIAGWQKNKQELFIDFDASNVNFTNVFVNTRSRQRSFEVFLESVEAEDLEWKFGFFYFRERSGGTTQITVTFLNPDFPQSASQDEVISQNHSAYGEISYWLTDEIRLLGGLRYTREEKRAQVFDLPTGDPGVSLLPPQSIPPIRWSDWTPRAVVEWQVTDTSLLAFSVTKGLKAGGFPGGDVLVQLIRECEAATDCTREDALNLFAYDEETVWQYQITSKNQLFDETLTANLTAFWTTYEQYQSCQINVTSFECISDGKAQLRGIEFESTWEPTPGLRINLNADFLDARLDEFFINDPVGPFVPGGPPPIGGGIPTDLRGKTVPRAPNFRVNTGVQYEIELGRYGFLTPRAQYTWQDKVFFRTFNRPEFAQKPFHQVDLRLIWRSADERFTVEGFVDNLTDVDVINNILIGPPIAGNPVFAFFRPPRTWGFRIGWHWQ